MKKKLSKYTPKLALSGLFQTKVKTKTTETIKGKAQKANKVSLDLFLITLFELNKLTKYGSSTDKTHMPWEGAMGFLDHLWRVHFDFQIWFKFYSCYS